MLEAIAILVFITAVLLVESLFLMWRGSSREQSRKIQQRIRAMSAGGGHGKEVLTLVRNQALSEVGWADKLLNLLPRVHLLDRTLSQSGTGLTVPRFLGVQLLVFLLMLFPLWFFSPLSLLMAALLAAVLAFILPLAYVSSRQQKRQEKVTEQLPDALEFIARSLRAGNPFTASIKAASEQVPDPLGPEFAVTFDEINYGLTLEDALYNMSDRIGTEDIRYFATAVIVQKQTGGNLAEVLQRLSEMMRKRLRTYRDIKTQAAEMKMSANVLIALPIVLGVAIMFLNPKYLMSLVNDPVGPYVLVGQAVFMIVGYWVMRRMINFRV
jgi:tight adherence protein B